MYHHNAGNFIVKQHNKELLCCVNILVRLTIVLLIKATDGMMTVGYFSVTYHTVCCIHSLFHSFIHIEHLYSASSNKLLMASYHYVAVHDIMLQYLLLHYITFFCIVLPYHAV